jgi:hypothetical protein
MNRITIIAGITQDRDGNPIFDTLTKLQRIRLKMAREFGGYTETNTYGGWINGEGHLVEEIGRQWVILADSALGIYGKAHKMAEFISFELNQDSVILEVIESSASFINQPPVNAEAQAA